MPMINGDLSSCSDASDISDDISPNGSYRSSNDICRDYLRNVCKRGQRCKYRHPTNEEAKNLGRQAQYTFCHDFQNSGCHRPNCKFMHCTREEEDYYKQTGQLPVRLQQAAALGIGVLPNKLPLEKGLVPVCKDFLKGECKRAGRCKFRHLSRSQYDSALRNNHEARASSPVEQYINHDTEYEHATKRRRLELLSPCTNNYISVPTAFQGSLEEENLYLRRKVELLKKQVSDLIATNEVLLEQNARYRVTKASIVTSAPPIVTVSQVVTPTIAPAPAMVRPALAPIQSTQQLTSGMSLLYEHHKSAELITLAQQAPPTLAQVVAQPPPPPGTINAPPPTVTMAQNGSNVIVPVSLTLDCITHPRSMPTASMACITHPRSMPTASMATAMNGPPPLTMDCRTHPQHSHTVVSMSSCITAPQHQTPIVSMPQTSMPAPQLIASAHNPALVSYPLISHSQQIPTSSMG